MPEFPLLLIVLEMASNYKKIIVKPDLLSNEIIKKACPPESVGQARFAKR